MPPLSDLGLITPEYAVLSYTRPAVPRVDDACGGARSGRMMGWLQCRLRPAMPPKGLRLSAHDATRAGHPRALRDPDDIRRTSAIRRPLLESPPGPHDSQDYRADTSEPSAKGTVDQVHEKRGRDGRAH